ncbi:MAG TPA: haloacid dehalogenase type II [Chloroflexota bacterium]|jgi:2-haloacid dehalogenase|nr:haloacid dehalogenase type II [Chloroflexota bacterium]
MPRIIAFDVNETLLDLRALDPIFQQVFGDVALRPIWFSQMLQVAFVGTITGRYVDFTTAQHAALRMVAARRGHDLSAAEAEEIVSRMNRLPAYPEVPSALRRLVDAGFRLAALTNSVKAVAEAQLTNAGLRGHFEQVLSADQVRRLKPAPEPYRLVAEQFATGIDSIRLVAAHAWDIAGALEAGCVAAFVARPGMVLSPVGPQPDIVGRDLQEVAEQIVRHDGAG